MQGLITLDFGNSHPHAGLFQKNNKEWSLLKVVPLSELTLYLSQFEMMASNTSVVLCEVKSRPLEVQKLQEQGFLITHLKDYWRGSRFAGMPVRYTKTLGEDRLIEAFYSYKLNQVSTLIIDAGTFVTMDVVSTEGFLGGYIIPSAQNYFEIFGKGDQLKTVPLNTSFTYKLPQETAEAMAESYLAFAAMAKNLIQEHKVQKIMLTGGDLSLWVKIFEDLKSSLVVEEHPHLIHWALQYWMTTQIEPL